MVAGAGFLSTSTSTASPANGTATATRAVDVRDLTVRLIQRKLFERILRETRFRFSDTLVVNRVANYPDSRQVLGASDSAPDAVNCSYRTGHFAY